jgi:hypothetical protein
MTFDTPSSAPGTARTNMLIGLVPPVSWDGLGRYGSYGPNIFGDQLMVDPYWILNSDLFRVREACRPLLFSYLVPEL